MFSRITMELSTSMPTPSARPVSVMRFSVSPEKYMTDSVTTSETGMARPIMSVVRTLLRKTNRITTASSAPVMAARETCCSEARIMSVVSVMIPTSVPMGRVWFISGSRLRTLSATCTELVPLRFWTMTNTPGCPLM
jgi:hypothetical protein